MSGPLIKQAKTNSTKFHFFLLFTTFQLLSAQTPNQCCHLSEGRKEFEHIRELSHKFVVIIGAQKSGTTLLYNILAQHPQTSRILKAGLGTGTRVFEKEDSRFERYLSFFNLSALDNGFTMIEATPTYILYPGAACKLKQNLPHAKIIVVLKNPADRALSQFKMQELTRHCNCKQIRNCPPCRNYLSDFYTPTENFIAKFTNRNCDLFHQDWSECFGCYTPEKDFIMRGLYAPQIKSWLRYFHAQQILVVNHKDIQLNVQQTADKIYQFANLEPFRLTKVSGFVGMKHAQTRNVNQSLELMENFFAPYNQMLYDLLERDFGINNFNFN